MPAEQTANPAANSEMISMRCLVGRCKSQMVGIGMSTTMKSVRVLMILDARRFEFSSMQFGVCVKVQY